MSNLLALDGVLRHLGEAMAGELHDVQLAFLEANCPATKVYYGNTVYIIRKHHSLKLHF